MKLSLRHREAIAVVVMAIGVVISFMKGGSNLLMMGIGAAIMGISILLHIKLARCPYCGAWLGKMKNDFCGKCGEKIDDNMKY